MTEQTGSVIKPQVVPIGRGAGWLFDGFGYFKKDPLPWIGVFILLFIFSVASNFVPFIGSLAMQLLLPVFFAGLILGCQTQEGGGEFTVNHLFAGFSKNTAQLVALGALYLAGVIIVFVILAVIVFVFFGGFALLGQLETGDVQAIQQNVILYLLLMLIGLALYLPLLMGIWFAPALVVLNDVSPIDAIKLSFTGCLVNVLPFLLYGVVGLVLSILAVIPFGLGLFILFPMITASVYISCKEIYQ